MKGLEDPAGKPPGAATKPPDPGDPGQGSGETTTVVLEDQPASSGMQDGQDNKREAVTTREEEDEQMPLSNPDSIVAETPDSQGELGNMEDEREEKEPAPDEDRHGRAAEVQQQQQGDGQPAVTFRGGQVDSPHEAQPEIQPEEMFAAVVAAMQEASPSRPREEWIATIAELYSLAHDAVEIDEERVPAAKKRYPKLKGDERALLTKFFKEAYVVSKGTYSDWVRTATSATRDLYNTSWSFKTILESMLGRVQWARAQPMNLWASKVKAGTTDEVTQNGAVKKYQTFMFDPSKFTKDDIAQLQRICEQPVAAAHGRVLREGTKDEWRIMEGMAKGTVVCRRVPAFVKSVLDSKEITRLNRTIQMQVEGELVLQLRGRGTVRASRRSTRAIKDDIVLAAVKAGVNLDEVQSMLNLTKTICYNYAQRSVHFFYFNRATARKYQPMYIPFQQQMYALVNVHGPDAGSVWDRQLARDGTRPSMSREYAVVIHNVTRFTDVGRLTAYLEKHIQGSFDLEDMDTCTPDSRTSTEWRLTMKSMECPEFLRGIVRIIWFGRSLILQHPVVGQRMQCLRCGNIGHPMARCSYTDRQLAGPGSRVAVDREVAQLEDLAKPFTSFAEMQVTAHKRLIKQKEAANKAEEAVRPDRPQAETQSNRADHRPKATAGQQEKSGTATNEPRLIAPAPPQPRVTLLKRSSKSLVAQAAALNRPIAVQPSIYAELEDGNESGDEREEKSEDNPPSPETIEISSGEDSSTKRPDKISEEQMAQLHLVKAKPQKLTPTPQLVALKQRERKALTQEIETLRPNRGKRVEMSLQPMETVKTDMELESRLGLRGVDTPASGNCMAMALAQAATDQDLMALPGQLERITALIKRGIGWTGQMNFLEQFDHFTRKMTLINVGRGWEGMDAHASSKQFRWYLQEYATSSSDPETFIPRHNWGSSEIMALAASFLQRKIFVMAYDVDHTKKWQCSLFKPGAGSKGRKVFEKGVQISLQLGRWMVEVQKEKAAGQNMPIVVRYWGEHYSAYVHTWKQEEESNNGEDQQDVLMEELDGLNDGPAQQMNEDPASAELQQGSSQEPWDSSNWDGNIADLQQRLAGLTIPHELQCEIHQILKYAEPQRYKELLAFLINTALLLSREQRERLREMTLEDDSKTEVKAMLQRFQISLPVLRQWQREVERTTQEEKEQMRQQDAAVASESDSEFEPSQASSSLSMQPSLQVVTRSKTEDQLRTQQGEGESIKRSHTMTLIEGEEIRQVQRSLAGPIPVMKSASASCKEEGASEAIQPARSTWPQQWQQLRTIWPLTAKIAFPLASGTMSTWTDTALKEPVWLLRTVQSFAYPEELLMKLSVRVFEAWTAVWRTECIYGRLVALRSATTDHPTRQWLDGWKVKFERHPPGTLPPLVDNSEDWEKMRAYGYGGDEILSLCDVNNRYRLAQHVICAMVYERELKALTGLENESENGAQTRLVRHLLALRTIVEYQQAYTNMPHTVNWRAVARFFGAALEHGDSGDIDHTENRQ